MKLLILLSFALSTIVTAVVLPAAVEPVEPIEPIEPIATAVAIALSGASGTDNTTMIFVANTTNNNPALAAADVEVANAAEAEALVPTAATAATATKPQITYLAHATQTTRPSDPEPIIIFPFSVILTEYCTPSSSSSSSSSSPSRKQAKALLQNGQFATLFYNLSPTTTAAVDHRIPDFPRTFRVGPYDGERGEVGFSYLNEEFEGGCSWKDGESWRECGECRVGMWDYEGVDCARESGGGRGERTKTMQCSFIMGWKHQFNGLVAPSPASSASG